MPRPTANTVTYANHSPIAGSFIVHRVTSVEVLKHVARPIREVIRRSYANSYEEPNGPLPKGTVDSRYKVLHHTQFAERATDHFRRHHSQYWVAQSEGSGSKSRMLGFAKTTPVAGDFYLNDVVVDPGLGAVSSQRRGYGTMLVHAALKYGGHGDRPLNLEAFELNEGEGGPNQMYRNMGLVRMGEADPFTFPNGSQLDMCLYSTPEGMTVNGVVQVLEARYPHLRQSFPSQVCHLTA
ncbi:MAG TPA: GNAT family N-acetyltransferase [Candidatus Saccharimonadales bacterium]|nr:GNAT family N-acetyltransferase [Candidatus Saccharimonadales bacterium]